MCQEVHTEVPAHQSIYLMSLYFQSRLESPKHIVFLYFPLYHTTLDSCRPGVQGPLVVVADKVQPLCAHLIFSISITYCIRSSMPGSYELFSCRLHREEVAEGRCHG